VHQDIDLERDGIRMLGAPSSVANSLPGQEKFTLDTAGPACRWLRLSPNGEINTGLLRGR
jgi:Icc protein